MTTDLQVAAEPIAPATTAAERLRQRVSFFASVQAIRPNSRPTAAELLADIRNGRWRHEIEAVRAAYLVDPAKADKLKRKLPGITFAGLFRTRSNGSLEKHSGLCVLDFDGLGDRLPDARRLLQADPHVLAGHVSPSGRGLKAIVAVDARDAATHRACFEAAETHFRKLGLVVDPSGKDVARLSFVADDRDAWIRPDSDPFTPFQALPSDRQASPSFLLSTPALQTPSTLQKPSTLQNFSTLQAQEDRLIVSRAKAVARVRLSQIEGTAPILVDLYRRVLANRFELHPHGRNQWLTEAMPFIFRALGNAVAVELAVLHLRIYRGLYSGSESEQRASFASLWAGCEKNYTAELSTGEREVYQGLSEPECTAFRICHSLAHRDANLTFYLACDHLALRLASPREVNGWRLLRGFEHGGILVLVAKGQRRAKGQRPIATRYRWALPTVTAAAPATPGDDA